jgi:hypothetical protein
MRVNDVCFVKPESGEWTESNEIIYLIYNIIYKIMSSKPTDPEFLCI